MNIEPVLKDFVDTIAKLKIENVTLQKQLEVADNYFKRIDGSRLDWFSTSCIAKEALAKIKELGGGL